MSKAETKRFIERAFRVLDTIYQSDRDWYTYLRQIETEERDHRRHCPVSSRWFTVPLAVKFLAVQRIAIAALGEGEPTCRDIFTLNPSLFMAAALAESGRPLRHHEASRLLLEFRHSLEMEYVSLAQEILIKRLKPDSVSSSEPEDWTPHGEYDPVFYQEKSVTLRRIPRDIPTIEAKYSSGAIVWFTAPSDGGYVRADGAQVMEHLGSVTGNTAWWSGGRSARTASEDFQRWVFEYHERAGYSVNRELEA